jgi:hypothetical protein
MDGVEKQVEVVAIDRSVQPPSFSIRVDGRQRETEAHRLSLDPSWSGKMINVTVKVIWPEVVASEFKRGERSREAALEVAVGPVATVSAVKAIVQEREDVPLERQQLVFGGGLQEDARTLASIGVADGHTLFVTVMSGVNVFVKELDGTQHTINIHLSDSVAALKAQIGKLKGWGADAIKLVCAGKLLAPDSASLSSLHVQKEMTIFVIMSGASGTKKYQLDDDLLEASWDYDFTNVKDTGCVVWACDVDGKELAFDRKDSAALEAQYTVGGGRGAVEVRSGKNFVDLARMVQVNQETKVERTVQRQVTNRKFERAPGFEYQRPCGWLRCALKVKGKYAEDRWLGRPGDREEADADEWPVCYHGTASAMAGARSDIAAEGYKASRGMRFPFSSSIYTTPDPRLAARYAQEFKYNGETWQIMFQNRVNPNTLERVASTRAGAEYWLSACADDVRPYGFLLRKAPVFGGEGKWMCDTEQGPKAYSTEDAAALEQAFALGVPRVVPVRKGVNEVNLDSMKQINVQTRVERPVTRL